MSYNLVKDKNAIVLLVPLVTLIFLPNNYDSFNLPKLISFILILNYLYIINSNTLTIILSKRTKLLILLAISLITVGTFNSKDVSSTILGNYAQNTGWLSLISCIPLAIFLLKSETKDLTTRIMLSISGTGLVVALYSIIQKIGIDPVKWKTEGWIVGTLGNPNFTSSFLAISFLILLIFLQYEQQLKYRIFYFATGMVVSIACVFVDSDQGYVIIATGIISILIFNFLRMVNVNHKRVLTVILGASGVIGLIFLFLNKEKISFLQESLQFRKHYWQTSWNIIKNNPLFGIGYGNFEDNFFRYRTVDHYLTGKGEFAASSHNYFLEMFSLGGILLGSGYAIYCIYVTIVILKLIRKTPVTKLKEVKLLAITWIGFLLQSLVSIPVIPFLVVGTLTSVLILKLNISINNPLRTNQIVRRKFGTKPFERLIKSFVYLTFILFSIIAITIISQERNLKQVIDFRPETVKELTKKMSDIQNLSKQVIYSEEYKYILAKNLFQQGLGYEAQLLMREASTNELHAYSKNWYLGYFAININRPELAFKYLNRAKTFDPMNLDLRRDIVLLLRKQGDLGKANIEQEELRKLAPDSPQFKSLLNET